GAGAVGTGVGGAAVAAAAGFAAPAPSDSSTTIDAPSLTLSPSLTRTSFTVPAAGEGTSIVALSDSSVTSESSAATASPGLTKTSMTRTSVKSPMSGTLTSIVLMIAAPLYRPWLRLGRVEVVLLHCIRGLRRRQRTFVGKRLQRGNRDVVAVDLEEPAQPFARVRSPEAVGAEHDIAASHEGANLVGVRAHVIGRGNDGARRILEAGLDVPGLRLGGGIHEALACNAHAVAGKLGEARATPEVGLHVPVALQKIGSGDHFTKDRAGTQQLDARPLRFLVTGAEQVHAFDDVGRGAFGHRRLRVILVHHRQVVITAVLLGDHPAQPVLDDDGDLVAERRIVRNAIGYRRRDHVRVAILVLQSFAVQRRAARGAAQ